MKDDFLFFTPISVSDYNPTIVTDSREHEVAPNTVVSGALFAFHKEIKHFIETYKADSIYFWAETFLAWSNSEFETPSFFIIFSFFCQIITIKFLSKNSSLSDNKSLSM